MFGAGTVFLAVAVSVPQFVRLRSGTGAAGVSLPAVVNSAVSFLAWTVYAVSIRDAWLIASSVIGLPFAVAVAVAAWNHGARRAGMWLPLLWGAALLATATAQIAGWDVARLVVGASIGWLVVPAVVTAWRSRDVSGIAPGSWWVLAVEGALFLGYGLARTQTAPLVYGALALAGAFAVLARLVTAGTARPAHLVLIPALRRRETPAHRGSQPEPRLPVRAQPLVAGLSVEQRISVARGLPVEPGPAAEGGLPVAQRQTARTTARIR